MARDVAEHVHGELDDRATDIMSWAHLGIMVALTYQDVDKELAQFFARTVQGRRIYQTIVAFDPDGRVIASAGIAAGVVGAPADSSPSAMSVVQVPDPEPGAVLRLEVQIPNPQRPSAVLGTLVALLEPARLLETMSASVPKGTAPVSLSLTDDSGRALAGIEPPVASYPSATSLLVATASIPPLSDMPSPRLLVRVTQTSASALAGAAALRNALLRVGLLVLLSSAAAGALVAWRISRPVHALTVGVREIAARGDLTLPVALPVAGGEIGVLSAAFRGMVESLARAQQESLAQSRLALLGEVAANVAHEVRTPLSVLKTSAHLLAHSEISPEERQTLGDMIGAEVDRLNGVVTALVDLARPKPVQFRHESLAAVVERAITFFRPFAGKRDIALEAVQPTHDVSVFASADQLHQVLLNLLQNALQAMTRPGRVTVRTGDEGATVLVEVIDTGPGFAPSVLPRAFSPFFTTKTDGTGLGLAIAQRIIEEHGGILGAHNAADGGAVVWFRLPVKESLS